MTATKSEIERILTTTETILSPSALPHHERLFGECVERMTLVPIFPPRIHSTSL